MTEEGTTVEVSCRIAAPAARIFEILSNPQRHRDFDGSEMLRGADAHSPIAGVGDTFVMKMHRLGREYVMVNHVVDFEQDRRIFWEPAPGDVETAFGEPSRVGIPAGYRWGYVLTPEGEDAAVVTEVFDSGPHSDLLREDGAWINGSTPVRDSMRASLERLEQISTE
jgi:uncharacterized protein YndB with AHSA1/START domain